jgi:hypothetical protein
MEEQSDIEQSETDGIMEDSLTLSNHVSKKDLGNKDFIDSFLADITTDPNDTSVLDNERKMFLGVRAHVSDKTTSIPFDPVHILNDGFSKYGAVSVLQSREEFSRRLVSFLHNLVYHVFIKGAIPDDPYAPVVVPVSKEMVFIYENALLTSKLAILETFYSKKMSKIAISLECFDSCMIAILKRLIIGIIEPGTMAGLISISAVTQILTQSTLNTFHYAGVKEKSAVVSVFATFLKLLNLNKSIESSSMFIKLTNLYSSVSPKILLKFFNSNMFSEFVISFTILATRDKEDQAILKFFDNYTISKTILNTTYMRLTFRKETMFERYISIFDLISVIKMNFPNAYPVITSNVSVLIFLQNTSEISVLSDLHTMKDKLQKIRVTGIKKVLGGDIRKITETEYGIVTTGSNINDILALRMVDHNRTYTTNLLEAYKYYGIEIAEAIFENEIARVLKTANPPPSLIDIMGNMLTYTGIIQPLNYTGLSKIDADKVFKLAQFNKPYDTFFDAAKYGISDDTSQISTALSCGNLPYGGTGMFDLCY